MVQVSIGPRSLYFLKRKKPMLSFFNKSVFYILMVLSAAIPAQEANEKLMIGRFLSASLEHWEIKEFKGQTHYQLTDLDGVQVLKADSADSASGLFNKQRIDLQKTPIMHWRWRIENRLSTTNEQAKSGDDYAARVYVVVGGGLAFWRTQAINYVWAGASPKGKVWPNAYAGDHAMMIALRSSGDQTGVWYTEQRNILADLKQQFGAEIGYIDAVAIMTDTDDTHGKVTAYYGDIYFSDR